MTLRNEDVTIEENGKVYSFFTTRLAGSRGPLPAVLVLQEIWGANAHIRDIGERFAKAGYFAVVPDLFADNGQRPELLSDERLDHVRDFLHKSPPQAFRDPAAQAEALSKLPEEERQVVRPSLEVLMKTTGDTPKLLDIVQAAFRYARRSEGCSGQVAAVGFCRGGNLAAELASAEPELAGAVVFYGRLHEGMAPTIQCPVLGLFGGLDPGITSLVPDFARAMEAQGKSFAPHVYDNARHAFFNDTGGGYDPHVSRDAWVRTLSFLNETFA